MKKKIILIFCLIISIFFVKLRDINSLAIISNIAIEKSDNRQYHIVFQEVIPKQVEGKTNKRYKYYEVYSNNIESAFKKIDDSITNEVYLTHLETVILNTNSFSVLSDLKKYFKYKNNFNIVFTDSDILKVIKFKNNYRYINNIVDKDIKFKYLNNKKVPIISFNKGTLKVTGYKVVKY